VSAVLKVTRSQSSDTISVITDIRQIKMMVTVISLSEPVRPKLHYMDTGYGHVVQHHKRTSSQQFCNKFTTSQCQSPT